MTRLLSALIGLALAAIPAAAQQPPVIQHEHGVKAVVFAPDGRSLATVTFARGWAPSFGIVKVWDAETGKQRLALQWKKTSAEAVAFSPDGRLLAVGGMVENAKGQLLFHHGVVRVCDTANGRELFTILGHGEPVTTLVFSPDGKFLATASADHTARLWDAVTGREVRVFKGHVGTVTAVAFSPDGKLLATGSGDKTARLWDVATGEVRRRLLDHSAAVTAVVFSPDGRTVTTGGADQRVYVWDAASGKK